MFTVGAALIDQYDTDDLFDPDPNPPNSGNFGNTITIIDTVGNGNPADYVYGIEGMSFDDPTHRIRRDRGYRSARIRRLSAGKLRTSQPAF